MQYTLPIAIVLDRYTVQQDPLISPEHGSGWKGYSIDGDVPVVSVVCTEASSIYTCSIAGSWQNLYRDSNGLAYSNERCLFNYCFLGCV